MYKLSIIVPVFNEEASIEQVIKNLFSAKCPIEREFIFIDDNSSDKSLMVLKSLSAKYGFTVLEQKPNQGKGKAVALGAVHAAGDFIMIQDADFEYDPSDVPSLLQPLIDGKADVVYGSRFKKSSLQVHRTYHYFINRFLTSLSNFFSGIYLTDMETCYKIFKADILKAMKLKSKRFGIEVELTAYLAKIRAQVFELPISYFPRTRLQGKKIGWKDGLAALFHILRYNLFTPFRKAFNNLPRKYLPGGDGYAGF
ncbi:MAG: glycosyltransferase family 2 protein [Bdellovibrionota bacterium]